MSLYYSPEDIQAAKNMANTLGFPIEEKHIETNLIMGFTDEYFDDFTEGCLFYNYTVKEDMVIGWVFVNPCVDPTSFAKVWTHTNHLFEQFDMVEAGRLN